MLPRRPAVLSKWSPFVLSFAVDCLFFINLCAWIFKCGCHSLWAGADVVCNIHVEHGKHCPFCSHGWDGQALVMIAIMVPQLLVSLRPWSWISRTLAALALFPVVEGLAGMVMGLVDGYWSH
jgi:hypothetical protein